MLQGKKEVESQVFFLWAEFLVFKTHSHPTFKTVHKILQVEVAWEENSEDKDKEDKEQWHHLVIQGKSQKHP